MAVCNPGASGPRASSIGLGCNNRGGRIDQAATKGVIRKALDLGTRLFDAAEVYGMRGGSEAVMSGILGDHRNTPSPPARASRRPSAWRIGI